MTDLDFKPFPHPPANGSEPDAEPIGVDVDELTIGDVEDFDDVAGRDFFVASKEGFTRRETTVLLWLKIRHRRPDLTLAEVRAMTLSQFTEAVREVSPEPSAEATLDPTGAGPQEDEPSV